MLLRWKIFAGALNAGVALAVTGCAITTSIPQEATIYWAYELRLSAQDGSNNVVTFAQWAPSEAACQTTKLDTERRFAEVKAHPSDTRSGVAISPCREVVVMKSTSMQPNFWAWTVRGWDGYGGGAVTQNNCDLGRKASAVLMMKSPCVPITATWK